MPEPATPCKRARPVLHLLFEPNGRTPIQSDPHTEDPEVLEAWIERARTGDADAFDRVARHYLPRIRRWALVRTGDPDDAEDVVQHTLVRAYRTIGGFRGDAGLGPWLYRITQNAALELFRRRSSRGRAMERLRAKEDPADAVVQPKAEGPPEVERLVRSFLDELSERQRAMMQLVDFEGHTPSEAAALLGLNERTARVHLLRARRAIRERILERRPAAVEDAR